MALRDYLLAPLRLVGRTVTTLATAAARPWTIKRRTLVAYAVTAAPHDTDNLSEPQLRTFVTWTPAQIQQAMVVADGGTLYRAADLCEMILGDDRASAVLNTRANALLGSPLSFQTGGRRAGVASPRGAPSKDDPASLALEEDWWRCFPEEEIRSLIIWGVLLGVGLAKIEWEQQGDREIPRIRVWHPRWLRWDWQLKQWFVKTSLTGDEVPITPGDGKWILYMPYGANRPWARGLWRGMANLWLFKTYAQTDWALHSEVHGQPIRTIFSASIEKVDPKLRKELAADLKALGRDTVIDLPPGFDFKLVEAIANTWEMFQAQIALANTSFSIAAIGTNLPTEVGHSAGTGATAQHLVRRDYTRADGQTFSTTSHDQVLVLWAKVNFGDPSVAPWPQWDVDPPSDTAALSTTWLNVANALASFNRAGYDIDPAEVQAAFNIPLRKIELPQSTSASGKLLPNGQPAGGAQVRALPPPKGSN